MPIRKNNTQANLAYTDLKQRITSGYFSANDRIRELDISALLGISRTPVREAIKRLEDEGLLTHEPRKGLVITQLDQQAITQLYALRELLEGGAARFAARYADEVELDNMRAILMDGKRDGDPIKTNYEFHQAIYMASHNQFLIKAINGLIDSISLLGQSTLAHTGRPELAHQEHMAVLDAICARDPDQAEARARSHIRQALLARLKLHRAGSAESPEKIETVTP